MNKRFIFWRKGKRGLVSTLWPLPILDRLRVSKKNYPAFGNNSRMESNNSLMNLQSAAIWCAAAAQKLALVVWGNNNRWNRDWRLRGSTSMEAARLRCPCSASNLFTLGCKWMPDVDQLVLGRRMNGYGELAERNSRRPNCLSSGGAFCRPWIGFVVVVVVDLIDNDERHVMVYP